MKATGIVRRIDDLGRVVIPKEIRRTMRIREGTPLEIYTGGGGEVIFRKYSPVGELGVFAEQYAEVMHRVGGYAAVICDSDHVVAVSGAPRRELLGRRVSPALEALMESRRSYFLQDAAAEPLFPVEGADRRALAAAPILAAGDVCGAVILLAEEDAAAAGESEQKLIGVAASFLGRQMEG